MNAFQLILALVIVIIAYFYIMVPDEPIMLDEPIMPETEIIPNQVINQSPKTGIISILRHTENNSNIIKSVDTSNVSNISDPFNVSISFTGYNGSKSKIAVEIINYTILRMPEISCNKSTYTPMPIFGENTSIYLFECDCANMVKAKLSFNNYSKSFFILECGNGWDFTLDS